MKACHFQDEEMEAWSGSMMVDCDSMRLPCLEITIFL